MTASLKQATRSNTTSNKGRGQERMKTEDDIAKAIKRELSHLSNSIGEMRIALSRLEELINLKGEVKK